MSSISNLWSAKSIAIIGASERVGAMGRIPLDYLTKFGYQGEIFPVNPKGESIFGLKTYKSVKEIGKEIDLALILVPLASVKEAVEDCAAAKVSIVTVMGSGFAEADEAGAKLQSELVKIAKEANMRLVGPNCIGSVGGKNKVLATFSPVFASESTKLSPGSIALVSQSGALGYGTYSLGMAENLPIGTVVTTGHEADVNAFEVAQVLSKESNVDGILIYAESLNDLTALKITAASKPTAILKSGRSDAGAAAAASHTGAMATGDRVVDAAIKASGAIRVNDIEELLDAGSIFSMKKKFTGKKIAIVTTSGGSGILGADAIEKYGLELAELSSDTRNKLDQVIPTYGSSANPVDVTAAVMSSPELFEQCLEVLVKDPNVEAIVAAFCVLVGDEVKKIATGLGKAKKIKDLPIVVARTGASSLAPEGAKLLADENIPIFPTPERAIRALSYLKSTSSIKKVSTRSKLAKSSKAPSASASEVELKELWRSAGVGVPESFTIKNRDEIKDAVKKVGGRAVLKAVIPGLLHKSDVGGVALDINEDKAPEIFDSLMSLAQNGDGAVLVERFVPKGVEVLVGITPSPLGQVLTVGVGGVMTEVIADTALRLLPVSESDIEEMIAETRLEMLFAGVRGAKPADKKSFIDTVLKITDTTMDWPEGYELDINPITVLPDGAWVLDSAYVAPK